MAMEEGLDTGPVLLEQRIPIQLLDSSIALAERLSALTADLMVQAMPLIEAAGPGSEGERLARLNVRVQAEESTYARMLEKQDFQLDWSASALSIHRKVMGLHPGAFTQWQGKRLKVLRTEPLIERLQDQLSAEVRNLVGQWPTGGHPPGTILAVIEDLGLVVSSSGCPLLIREAQLEGKARSTAPVLFQQLKATPGDRFGEG
jgi:methionyl-tRNA formyltransferase